MSEYKEPRGMLYRKFLEDRRRHNRNPADSYVRVEDVGMGDTSIHLELKIADCNRSVSLAFTAWKGVNVTQQEASRRAALLKVARLQEALDIVRVELECWEGGWGES